MTSVKLYLDNNTTTTVVVDDSTFRDDEYERDLDVYLLNHYRDYEYVDYEILG